MKKILLTFGTLATTFAPLVSVIACGNDHKKNVTWDSSTRTDAEIVTELTENVNHSVAISASLSFGANRAQSAIGGSVEEQATSDYWNKPEGSTIRLAAIVTAIGEKIWGAAKNGVPGAGDQVIRAIIFGVIYDLKQKNIDDYANKTEDEQKKIASTYLNEYKVALIDNINKFLNDNNATDSLQKFDGFLNWFTDSTDTYKNLKSVLIGGKINENVIQGIQDELNKPTDSMQMITPVNTNIVIVNPTP